MGSTPNMSDCIVLSDLHLFSRRSRVDDQMSTIRSAVRGARTLVLAGDIVDFKWSTLGSFEATAVAARAWLEGLLEENEGLKLRYVLGNHDHLPEWMDGLNALSDAHGRFNWDPYYMRLGNAFFLHGDVCNPRMDQERLGEYRASFAGHSAKGPRAAALYDVVLKLKLHVLGAKLLFPPETVMRRISRYIDELGDHAAGVRNVYFGHTHLALFGDEYEGRRFHNCGAPMHGLDFRIVTADLA